jgi:hypothetical protein
MFEFNDLIKLKQNIDMLRRDLPNKLQDIVDQEGLEAVKNIKRLTPVNTGNLRRTWRSFSSPLLSRGKYEVFIENNSNYAKHVEYGHRVARNSLYGYFNGKRFVRLDPSTDKRNKGRWFNMGSKTKVVRGVFMMKQGIHQTQTTQSNRIQRKINKILKEYLFDD